MVKKLYYYFYLTEGFSENKGNILNLRCLERYAHIFDEAKIFLSVESGCRLDLIKEAEKRFLEMPFNGNISFKVVENSDYRESKVVKEEILDKIDELDCLLFFAHGKGFTNFKDYSNAEDDMKRWIIGCYYLSLEHIDEVESTIGPNSVYSTTSFGSFPVVMGKPATPETVGTEWDKIFPGEIKYNWYYSGCFFWINTLRMYNYLNTFSVKQPKMQDRYFSEKLLGNLMPFTRYGVGHNSMYLYPCNFYNKGVATSSLCFILGKEEYAKFEEFYNKVTEGI